MCVCVLACSSIFVRTSLDSEDILVCPHYFKLKSFLVFRFNVKKLHVVALLKK